MANRNLRLHKWMVFLLPIVIVITILLNPPLIGPGLAANAWRLTFSDDFNDKTLNTQKWNTCYWWSTDGGCKLSGNLETQWYQPNNVIVQDGILRLQAQKQSLNGYHYTSGMVSSHDKYSLQYGYVEMRAKLPQGKGLWPAFWLIPQARNVWPPELDVMENLGHEPGVIYMTVHYQTETGPDNSGTAWDGLDLSSRYHKFAMLWEPKYIIWYVDGVERKRYEVAANIPAQPLYLVANLAVGPAWKNAPPDATTPFPSYYDIDYIKVWQRRNSKPF